MKILKIAAAGIFFSTLVFLIHANEIYASGACLSGSNCEGNQGNGSSGSTGSTGISEAQNPYILIRARKNLDTGFLSYFLNKSTAALDFAVAIRSESTSPFASSQSSNGNNSSVNSGSGNSGAGHSDADHGHSPGRVDGSF